jgi:hypothetical protein
VVATTMAERGKGGRRGLETEDFRRNWA